MISFKTGRRQFQIADRRELPILARLMELAQPTFAQDLRTEVSENKFPDSSPAEVHKALKDAIAECSDLDWNDAAVEIYFLTKIALAMVMTHEKPASTGAVVPNEDIDHIQTLFQDACKKLGTLHIFRNPHAFHSEHADTIIQNRAAEASISRFLYPQSAD